MFMHDAHHSDHDLSVYDPTDQEGLSLTDLLISLGHHKRFLFTILLAGSVISTLVIFLLPRYFAASTVLLPPQQQNSAAVSALSQLGAVGGIGNLPTIKTPDEMYVALLRSRSVQDDLIVGLKLMDRYGKDSMEQTRTVLDQRVTITNEKKSGFIRLAAEDPDAVFAANLANAHVAALRRVLTRLALTDAQQRRMFFDQQVGKTKELLNDAEVKFRQAQAESGLVVTQALAEAGVKESAQLRGQIAAREVQLQTLTRFATSEHPEVQRTSAELSALRRQLTLLEQGTGGITKQVNFKGTKAVQAYRDMKIQEALLETLIRQLEMARADEAKEGPLLQQIDIAKPPERPAKPKRLLLILFGLIASSIMAIMITLIRILLNNESDTWRRIKMAWL
jgi:tyrosine-protein kinase Etk/Wzc